MILALVFLISSVQGLKIVPDDEEEEPPMLFQLTEEDDISNSSRSYTRSSAMASLLRDAAPRLYDDSEIKRMIELEVGQRLEERLKFFPGMTSLQQLLEWNTKIAGPRLGPVKDLPKFTSERRIMSMHDMATGYNEAADNDYMMLFQTWQAVDIFVYFSHVKFAVPPLQWTMVAHQHGRPAIGTIIFEPSPGVRELVREMLEKREEVQDRLVDLADHYGFDGWFVNIENSRSDWPAGDPIRFVQELRTKLKKKLGERAQIITYPYGPEDQMFQVSDAVFVNYNWNTRPAAMQKLVKDAGSRTADVYMGMDAFGSRRGDNEPDPDHVQLCAKHNLSIAIFAPGFTYEIAAERKFSQKAVNYDHRYWYSIAENFGKPVVNAPKSGQMWPVPWEEAPAKAVVNPSAEYGAVAAAGAVVATVAGAALGAELPAAAAVAGAKVATAVGAVTR